MAGNSGRGGHAGQRLGQAATEPGRDGREQPRRARPASARTASRYGARPGWPGTDLGGRRVTPEHVAATEPGRDGREQVLGDGTLAALVVPLRSPAGMAGNSTAPDGACYIEQQPLRSPAGMAGNRIRELTARVEQLERPLRSPAGMAGNSGTRRSATWRRTRRYGARPGWPGTVLADVEPGVW